MKSKYLLLLAVVSALLFLSTCDLPPDLPDGPEISFEKIEYIEGTRDDSLIVTIYFKDGDGDLGLRRDDVNPPYNEKFYFKDQNGNYIKYGMSDTLPPFEPPYNCINYSIEEESPTQPQTDTFYIVINEDYYNIFVRYFIKQQDGSYEEFDWRTFYGPGGGCFNYNGRFPNLNSTGTERPLEGTFSYSMVSRGFENLFVNDTLQLEVRIQDRALNKSNWIRTPDFTIAGLKAAGRK